MARIYAGILGPLAFLTALARGWLHGGTLESQLWNAWTGLLVFAAIGCVVGWIANTVVEDAVHGQIAAGLATEQESKENAAAGPAAVGR